MQVQRRKWHSQNGKEPQGQGRRGRDRWEPGSSGFRSPEGSKRVMLGFSEQQSGPTGSSEGPPPTLHSTWWVAMLAGPHLNTLSQGSSLGPSADACDAGLITGWGKTPCPLPLSAWDRISEPAGVHPPLPLHMPCRQPYAHMSPEPSLHTLLPRPAVPVRLLPS